MLNRAVVSVLPAQAKGWPWEKVLHGFSSCLRMFLRRYFPAGGDSAGTIAVNEIAYIFNNLGMLEKEYQEHEGPKNGSTLYAEYAYDTTVSGGKYTKGMRFKSLRPPATVAASRPGGMPTSMPRAQHPVPVGPVTRGRSGRVTSTPSPRPSGSL